MSLSFVVHWNSIHFTPEVSYNIDTCPDPECSAVHHDIALGWLFWHVVFSF